MSDAETPSLTEEMKLEYFKRLRSVIDEHGWAVQAVGAGPDTHQFAYTVGLHEKGLPEILLIGLPYLTSHSILNAAAKKLIASGRPRDGQVDLDLLVNYPAVYRDVPSAAAGEVHTCIARAMYGDGVEVVQLVWPDVDGKFPWDPECDGPTAESQSAVVAHGKPPAVN